MHKINHDWTGWIAEYNGNIILNADTKEDLVKKVDEMKLTNFIKLLKIRCVNIKTLPQPIKE